MQTYNVFEKLFNCRESDRQLSKNLSSTHKPLYLETHALSALYRCAFLYGAPGRLPTYWQGAMI